MGRSVPILARHWRPTLWHGLWLKIVLQSLAHGGGPWCGLWPVGPQKSAIGAPLWLPDWGLLCCSTKHLTTEWSNKEALLLTGVLSWAKEKFEKLMHAMAWILPEMIDNDFVLMAMNDNPEEKNRLSTQNGFLCKKISYGLSWPYPRLCINMGH